MKTQMERRRATGRPGITRRGGDMSNEEYVRGIMAAHDHLMQLVEAEQGSTDDEVWDHLRWCEQQGNLTVSGRVRA